LPQLQQGRHRTWREAACQRTRRARQLGENRSRWAVGAVSGERVDAGHHGGEHRGRELGCGHSRHRTQDRAHGAAGSAGAALVLAGIDVLGSRSCGGCVFIRDNRSLVVLVTGLGNAAVMSMVSGCRCMHLISGMPAMVIESAERHGRGGNALRGDGENHQPDQKRSNPHTHCPTLPQRVHPAPTTTLPLLPGAVPSHSGSTAHQALGPPGPASIGMAPSLLAPSRPAAV
jgi:hypothetical protein